MLPLTTLDDIAALAETEEVECKLAAGRDGTGQLPADFWPTYSAFANTRGGVVILGLRERGRDFELVGLADPEKVRTDLFNALNNPQKVSTNLLDADRVSVVAIEGRKLLVIEVPRASRKHRPVYINGNPMTGTYRRSDTGDRLVPPEIVRAMLAEQVEDSRDNRILRGFGPDDLSAESVRAYRQAMRDRTPTHPFLDFDDPEFLRRIGAHRRDRETGEEGLTVAGLLMFGLAENIRDEFPNYHLDYQERPRSITEARWVDRLTLDGTWSGNLFDFYRRVSRKLAADLKVPFALRDGQRQDETPVHEALREALVNTLVHADYTGRASVLVVKRPDMFGFRNPGRMRIPVSQAIVGGESDGRNRTLQSMFLLIGAGERAGSGVPKIHKGWRDQHWAPPALYDLDEPLEQTRLELRMSDLIPTEATERLRALFGSRLDGLTPDGRLILATAATEGVVTHARMLSICDLHPVDLSRALGLLVAEGFLVQTGRTRGAVYRLVGTVLPSPEAVFAGPTDQHPDPSGEAPDLIAGGPGVLALPPELTPGPSLGGRGRTVDGLTQPLVDALEGLDPAFRHALEQAAAPVRNGSRVPPAVTRLAVLELCRGRFLTIKVLAALLGRDEDYLRKEVLNPLVRERGLERAFPQAPNDPRQAYTTVPGA